MVINGPSGSGKTTFARAVSGVLVHAYGGDMTGSITIAGKYADEYEDVTDLSKQVGMVFDDADAQLIFTTVEEEILTGLETRGLSVDEVAKKLDEIYKITCTGHLKDRAPHALSALQWLQLFPVRRPSLFLTRQRLSWIKKHAGRCTCC